MDESHLWAIGFICIIVGTVILMTSITDNIDEVLDRACNEYNMDYEYRAGGNCLDKDDVIHPITSDCDIWIWSECNIRFIKEGD